MPVKTVNRHPVDQLADIREQQKALVEQERQIKDQIIKSLGADQPMPGESRTINGDEHVATITVSEQERLDRKKVEALLSGPKFQSCLKTSTVTTIRTAERQARAA